MNSVEKRVRIEKFPERFVKLVAAKMRASGRPATDYSKTTGKLKKSAGPIKKYSNKASVPKSK